MNFIAEAR